MTPDAGLHPRQPWWFRPPVAIGIAVCLVLLAHVPEWVNPPWMDQGLFEVIARELNAGKRLYTDIIEIKPPAIFWAFRAVRLTLGPTHQAVVAADGLTVLATMALMAGALLGRMPDRALAMGFLFWGMLAWLVQFSGNPALLETEVLENLVVAALLYLSVKRPLGPIVVGALVALGALIKLVPAAVILGVAVVAARPAERVRLFAGAGAVATALLMFWVGTLWADGTLEGAREALFLVLHQSDIWRISPLGYAGDLTVVVPLALVAVMAGPRNSVTAPLSAWFLLAALQVWVQGRYFGYHFAALLPPAALLAGTGLDLWLERAPVIGARVAVIAFLIQAALSFNSQINFNALPIAYELGQITRDQFENGVQPTWGLTAFQIRAAATQARLLSRPGESMFVLGVVPQLLLWADRPMFGRYLAHYFLLVDSALCADPEDRPLRQARFMEGFRRAPPRLVVVPDAQGDVPGLLQNRRELASFPQLADALERDYELHPVGPLGIYVRKDAPPASP